MKLFHNPSYSISTFHSKNVIFFIDLCAYEPNNYTYSGHLHWKLCTCLKERDKIHGPSILYHLAATDAGVTDTEKPPGVSRASFSSHLIWIFEKIPHNIKYFCPSSGFPWTCARQRMQKSLIQISFENIYRNEQAHSSHCATGRCSQTNWLSLYSNFRYFFLFSLLRACVLFLFLIWDGLDRKKHGT